MGSNPLLGFIFPSAFSILFTWHLPETLDLLFKLFLQQQKGAQTSDKPNLPAKHQMISVQWDENIQYPAEPVCVNGSQGNIQRVMSFCCCVVFLCNRLWNGSWHCFSRNIVAWTGTTGVWDSSLTSVQQHPFLLSSAKFYELDHPISVKAQRADIGNKSD